MHSKAHETFKPNRLDGFTSKIDSVYEPCAPYAIAQVARDRVMNGSLLQLPEGYDKVAFDRVCFLSGRIGVEYAISLKQGRELRDIGAQLLALDNDHMIKPPLGFEETQSIRRLIHVVDATSAVIANRQ